MNLLLLEPSFFGLGYFAAAKALKINVYVLTRDVANAKRYGYYHDCAAIVEVDLNCQKSAFGAVEKLQTEVSLSAALPGSQLATPIAGAICQRFGLAGLDANAALLGVNKDFARKAYAEHQVPSAKYALVDDATGLDQLASKVPFPMVLKPVASSSSLAVELIGTLDELKARYGALKDVDTAFMGFTNRRHFMVEQLLQGEEYSVELAIKQGQVYFDSITAKLKTPLPYFVELGHVSPANVPAQLGEQMVSVAVDACKALGLVTGVFHVELINADSGPCVVEVNPRPGGDKIASDLVPLSLGVDLYGLHLNMLLDPDLEKPLTQDAVAAIFFITASQEGEVCRCEVADWVHTHPAVRSFEWYIKPGDRVKSATSSADRVGHFMLVEQGHDAIFALKHEIETAIGLTIVATAPDSQ